MRIMNDRRSVQASIFPALLVAITRDALQFSEHNRESEVLTKLNERATELMFETMSRPQVLKRLEKGVNEMLKVFVDKRDGKYHIRKVMLALYGVTQEAFDNKIIGEEIGWLIQEALNLEGEIPMEEEDWLKLKDSADKKCQILLEIIRNV